MSFLELLLGSPGGDTGLPEVASPSLRSAELVLVPSLYEGTGLALGTAGRKIRALGFPLVTCKRIRPWDKGQGAFILPGCGFIGLQSHGQGTQKWRREHARFFDL